jgi:ABC-type lipoprotein release transport system permease subunit
VLVSPLIALVIGSLISIVASIAPAYWAARKQPVEAMRVEE